MKCTLSRSRLVQTRRHDSILRRNKFHRKASLWEYFQKPSSKFHNIHRRIPVSEPLFENVVGLKAYNFNKKVSPSQVFSCEYCKIFKNSSFYRTPLMLLLYLFNTVAGLKTSNIIKSRLQHKCFPVKFAKVLRTTFFTEHLWWLLLNKSNKSTKSGGLLCGEVRLWPFSTSLS